MSTDLKLFAINDELQKGDVDKSRASIGRYIFDVLPDDPLNPSGSQVWKASLEKVLANRKPDEMPIVKYSVTRPKIKMVQSTSIGEPAIIQFWILMETFSSLSIALKRSQSFTKPVKQQRGSTEIKRRRSEN